MQTLSTQFRVRKHAPRRRSGLALIYMGMCLFTLLAICSLAVDFGRWEMCKTELQRAADAAARAGALALRFSPTTALSTATSVAGGNYVDNTKISSNSNVSVTVQLEDYISATDIVVLSSGSYSLANAVNVTISYNVPLVFGSTIGISHKEASRSSTSMLNKVSQTIFAPANGDPWLAGEPTGTQGSQPDPNWAGQGVNSIHPWKYDIAGPVGGSLADGERYSSPAQLSINITPGAIIAITNVSGSGNYNDNIAGSSGTANGQIDGYMAPIYDDAASNGVSEHGIADVSMPLNSMVAVFLGSGVPDDTAAPSSLDFSTQQEQDYVTLAPKVKQPFFAGTGQTSGGTQQWIQVPSGATRMYVGMMDGWEWSNDYGGYNATITEYTVTTVQ
jgi:Flp pilus assembly protein TadG